MKRLLFIFTMALFSQIIVAQSDIIYTSDSGRIIFDCRIIEVNHGNMVVYSKDSINKVVEAFSIIKNGKEINLSNYSGNKSVYLNSSNIQQNKNSNTQQQYLYNGKDYNYYMKTYKRAISQRNTGIIFTILGTSTAIVGVIKLGGGWDPYLSDSDISTGSALYITGEIVSSAGIILLISGAVKANNNQKAMEQIQPKLSLGLTSNGFGLTLAFR